MRFEPRSSWRRVLVVDDDEQLRQRLIVGLTQEGFEAMAVASAHQALAELERRLQDWVVADVRMSLAEGGRLLDEVRRRAPRTSFMATSPAGGQEVILEAIRRGAYDCLAKPFRVEDLVLALRKAEERERLLGRGEGGEPSRPVVGEGSGRIVASGEIVARSPRMEELLRLTRKIAEYKTTVLVTGESGTGKEMVARVLHEASPRRGAPFVPVNCCAIPEALLESELFGHRKGAFTDAHRDKPGRFEEASSGTLFLDEIGDLPLLLQVKLLRALQEQEIRPLGSTSDVKVDVRVVAATVRNLPEEVAAGRFREDLYYRLNVFPIHLPPLRERKEEIPALVELFVAKTNRKLGTHIQGVSPEAMQLLMEHSWPGNVRELENTVERAIVLAEGELIEPEGLPEKLRQTRGRIRPPLPEGAELSIKKATRVIEEELIRRALRETRGNRTYAAKILEISHRALLYKIKDYGIEDL
jgi:two-component system response regulator AtoC